MAEPEPPNRQIIDQGSQIPAESLFGTAIGASKTNTLPESMMTSDEKTKPDAIGEASGLVQDMRERKDTPATPVLYKVRYIKTNGDIAFSKESKEPMGVQNTLSALGQSVIEVITDVQILGSYTTSNDEKEEPQTAISVLNTKLKINSPAIIAALQSVIEYYPGHNFSEASNTIVEPYAALIHHEEELKTYRDQFSPNTINSEHELCHRNVNAYEHLGILKSVLFERSGMAVEAERQRHARGVATFEMLWLLFRPGTDVYCDIAKDGNYNACVIKSVSSGIFGGRRTLLTLDVWSMDYDGDKIGRQIYQLLQPMYDGEKEITSLAVFPCQFWKETPKEGEEDKPLKMKLEERGKMFFKLAQRQCMDYSGTNFTWPKHHVSVS